MPKLDPHDPHLADILRRASLEREQQDQRLVDIFGTHMVPKVTEEAFAISPSISPISNSIWSSRVNSPGSNHWAVLPGKRRTSLVGGVPRSMPSANNTNPPTRIPIHS